MEDVDPEDTQSATLIDREVRKALAKQLAPESAPLEARSEARASEAPKSHILDPPTEDDGALEEKTLDMSVKGRAVGNVRTHAPSAFGPEEPMRDSERTLLDLAAQLGMAPEPAPSPPPPTRARPSGADPAVGPLPPLRMTRARPPALDASAPGVKIIEGEGLAGLIPIGIAAFVLITAFCVGAWALGWPRGRGTPTHAVIRILPSAEEGAPPAARRPGTNAPLLTVETDPEGVLIVLNGKLIGPTPVTFESPIESGPLTVELASPYFETWVDKASPEVGVGYRIHAKLARKR